MQSLGVLFVVTMHMLLNAWGMLGISLGMRLANERRRYIVMASLIGWAHT